MPFDPIRMGVNVEWLMHGPVLTAFLQVQLVSLVFIANATTSHRLIVYVNIM
jgi:hypothetical protein